MKKGKLITFEGDDNTGKSTQAAILTDRLKSEGYTVVQSFEPGGTELGRVLRDILLRYKGDLSKATELFLFQADRAQHYKEVIKPAIKAGHIVICDRFIHSTLVYQGTLRGWAIPFLWRLHSAATGLCLPDLTIVLDGSPHTSGDTSDRFEGEDPAFHKRVREAYRWQARVSNGRCALLSANQDRGALAEGIYQLVQERVLHS